MGSANGLPHAPEGPEHIVEITEFWTADSPVTVEQYQAVMGHNPSQFDGAPGRPRRQCELGRSMRLLLEAQREQR
jgi:formylglycine-generating enzyme required for sulfatase activity